MCPAALNGAFRRQKSLRVGLIGIGQLIALVVSFGFLYRGYNTHFLASLETGVAWDIVAVCDVNEEVRTSFSGKHPTVPTYSDLDDLISCHSLDFAILAVPHCAHLECCTALAKAGIPILKEKPVAATWEEYSELSRLPVKIGIMFQKRFESRYQALRNLLPQVGQVASFRATLADNIADLEATWRADDDVGVTEDLGCHMLDIVVWLFGIPTSVIAQNARGIRKFQSYGGDDVSNVTLNFGENATHKIGHVHLSRVSHRKEESFIVTGDQGTLVLEDREITMRTVAGNEAFKLQQTSQKRDAVASMVQDFASWVQGKSTDFSTSLENLEDMVRVGEAIRRSDINPGTTETLSGSSEPLAGASLEADHHVWPLISRDSEHAVINQMHSSLSIYDRSNIYESFEDCWRNMHGLKHALVCSSGTVAICHMFEALDLRPGDEILCPVYTFFATASPMLQYGAVPIFCDALPDGNLDPAEIGRRSTAKTKAVIVTHMWGLPCRMRDIVEQAAKTNGGIRVLEDCSHAHFAKVDGRLVGTWGDIAAWSLQAKKNITGGQAGVMATNSMDFYSRAILHGHFNKRAKQEVPENHPLRKFWLTGLGLNLRAHPLAIAFARQQLESFGEQDCYRQEYATYLAERLSLIPFLTMPQVVDDRQDRHAWYAFVMQFNPSKAPQSITRESFVQQLLAQGLKEVDIPRSTGLLNELPLFTHSHEAIPRYGEEPWHEEQPTANFPVADQFYQQAIKLPMWSTRQDRAIVEHYARVISSVAEGMMERSPRKTAKVNGFHEVNGVH